MGRKKANKDPGRQRQVHPQKSFKQMVADTTTSSMKEYIDNQVQLMGQALIQRQAQMQEQVLIRIVAIEELLLEKFEGLTKDDLANRVADIQDRSQGFAAVSGAVELGDRVRLEVKIKPAGSDSFENSQRFMLENAGSGNTLGAELENEILGMKAGEVKELPFGKDKSALAALCVGKVSRRPQPVAPVAEVPKEEESNEDNNAG